MVKITLKDGSIREAEAGSTIMDVAKSISEGLARVALAADLDGVVVDMSTIINKDCYLNLLTFDTAGGKLAFWHTSSHIMAQAVKKLFPSAKLAIGPSIENGCYYDFDVEQPFTPEDLEKIEKEMANIVKADDPLIRSTMPIVEALEQMNHEPYKQ